MAWTDPSLTGYNDDPAVLAELLYAINEREEYVGLTPTTWTFAGAVTVDPKPAAEDIPADFIESLYRVETNTPYSGIYDSDTNMFEVDGASWTPNEFAGDILVDRFGYACYIESNGAGYLTLNGIFLDDPDGISDGWFTILSGQYLEVEYSYSSGLIMQMHLAISALWAHTSTSAQWSVRLPFTTYTGLSGAEIFTIPFDTDYADDKTFYEEIRARIEDLNTCRITNRSTATPIVAAAVSYKGSSATSFEAAFAARSTYVTSATYSFVSWSNLQNLHRAYQTSGTYYYESGVIIVELPFDTLTDVLPLGALVSSIDTALISIPMALNSVSDFDMDIIQVLSPSGKTNAEIYADTEYPEGETSPVITTVSTTDTNPTPSSSGAILNVDISSAVFGTLESSIYLKVYDANDSQAAPAYAFALPTQDPFATNFYGIRLDIKPAFTYPGA